MNFDIVDINLTSKVVNSPADCVKIFVEPENCCLAAGNFSRGLFLCSNLETVVSEYVLLPNGNTCYAYELIGNHKKIKELFSYQDGKAVPCNFVKAEMIKALPSEIISYKYSEPVAKESNYYPYLKDLYYVTLATVNTEVLPKMVKFRGGTHFGTRIEFENCLEW